MDFEADEKLARFAASNHGLFRTKDAQRLGLSREQIARRVRRGRIERLGRGVYRMRGAPATRHQSILAATWRSQGVASHRTSAELHGLWVGAHKPEVTVHRSGMHHLDGALVHRSGDLASAELVRRKGIVCTGVPRTLVDLGAVASTRAVEKAVHQACQRNLTTVDEVVAEYLALSRKGRHGCGAIRDVLKAIDPMVELAESELELVLLEIIRTYGLPAPELQFLVLAGGRRFRLDVAYPEHRLFIEGDGFGVHGTRTAFEDDRWRQNLLVVAGWRVLRFTWRQLVERPAEVARQIRVALGLT